MGKMREGPSKNLLKQKALRYIESNYISNFVKDFKTEAYVREPKGTTGSASVQYGPESLRPAEHEG